MDETYSVEKLWDTIAELEGMVKELAERCAYKSCGSYEWIKVIAHAPSDDPVKLHEVIKAALSFRWADKLEVEDENKTA